VDTLPPLSSIGSEAPGGSGGSCNTHLSAKNGTGLAATEAGVDTWRLVRYLDTDAEVDRAAELCPQPSWMGGRHPQKLAGHNVGVMPGHRLLWMEGHPAEGRLASRAELPAAEQRLLEAVESAGLPTGRDAGCARLDSTATLAAPDMETGLTLLAGLGLVDVPRTKPSVIGRPPQTVTWLSPTGHKVLARAYDKGLEGSLAPRGRLIRLEAQTRYTKEARRAVIDLDPEGAFAKRFTPVAQSADGLTAATFPAVTDRVAELVTAGRITPQQAERLIGHLALTGKIALPRRTRFRRQRELRDAGLVMVDALNDPIDVDLGEALYTALAGWSSES
jgi:hypothetical protein